jgi:hypothetical protein
MGFEDEAEQSFGPAWRQLGVEAWAQYSRDADLGTGLIAYPIEAIGPTLLIVASTAKARHCLEG